MARTAHRTATSRFVARALAGLEARRWTRWSFALVLSAAATAAPLFVVRFLPFTDAPEHVAAIATIARLLPGGGGDHGYVAALSESQYFLYDLLGALGARALGDAVLANRLLLATAAFTWPFAFRSLLRALGRDDRLALLSPMLFWSRALVVGFLPFVASVPLALFALATFTRHLAPAREAAVTPSTTSGRRPRRARATAMVAALFVLAFYAHVSTYMLVVATALTLVVVMRAVGAISTGQGARAMGSLLPSAACTAWWWSASALDGAGDARAVRHLPARVALDAAPLWALDIWRSHLDELWASVFWIAFALLVVDGLRRAPSSTDIRRGAVALAPLAVATAVYLVTPFRVGAAGYLDVRLAPLLVLFAIAALRAAPAALRDAGETGGGRGHLVAAALTLGTLATVGTAATAAREMRRLERDVLGDLQRLLDAMPEGTRLASLNFDKRAPGAYFYPYVFAGSYHRLKPGTVAAYSFAELPHWPVHYREGHAPPRRADFWTYAPCVFRHRADGAYYDYVLVQGRVDPFAAEHPGPRFTPVGATGVFTLFAKDVATPERRPDLPDASVCPTTAPTSAPSSER